ncbi:MAG: LTA synthase family protein [Thiohalospira sp.]
MKNYAENVKIFLYRFLFLIALFSLSRFIFYIFNINYFGILEANELLKIFFYGVQFDISALFYFNLPFIILSLIPGDFKIKKNYQKTLRFLFVFLNAILLSMNFVDTKFFDFEHKRLTSDFFSSVWLGEDFFTLLPAFIKDYWYLIILWIVFVYALFRFYPKIKLKDSVPNYISKKQIIVQSLFFILLMGIGLIGGRGGLQLKPLRVIHAAKYTNAKNIPIVLNTPFTIMKSFGVKSFEVNQYFDQNTLDSIYTPIHHYKSIQTETETETKSKPQQNIVLIILESFSKEYIGYFNDNKKYTPFLDSLCFNSLVHTNGFANGKRSIEAMPSIIAGLPALTDNPYITSQFSSNKIDAIPSLLKELGYKSAFFHGGKNGTMGFDQFANIAGFDHYFGMDEYPYESHFDGNWGISDEEYFLYFKNQLDRFNNPFFATLFTLTSHHPYQIPAKYKGHFPKGNLNIHESIGYTDYALKQFFKAAQNSMWYKNTLFIIVADHTAQAESEYYKNKVGNYAIPIILFHPSDSTIKGNSNNIAQQTDIFPTVMDYCGYNKPFIAFGKSLFSDTTDNFTVNYLNGIYQIIEDNYLLQFDGKQSLAFYNITKDSLLKNNLISSSKKYHYYENKLKAFIQSYQQRLNQNQLSAEK